MLNSFLVLPWHVRQLYSAFFLLNRKKAKPTQNIRYKATGPHPRTFQTPESVAMRVTTNPIALLTTTAVIIACMDFSEAGTFLANHNKILSKIKAVPNSCVINAPEGLNSSSNTEPSLTGKKVKPMPNTITTVSYTHLTLPTN